MTPTGADPAPGMGRASRCPVDHLTPRRRTGEAHARFGHQGCTRHCRMEDAWRKPHRWSTTLAEFCALTGPGHAHVGGRSDFVRGPPLTSCAVTRPHHQVAPAAGFFRPVGRRRWSGRGGGGLRLPLPPGHLFAWRGELAPCCAVGLILRRCAPLVPGSSWWGPARRAWRSGIPEPAIGDGSFSRFTGS
jgi:hypothetical protein